MASENVMTELLNDPVDAFLASHRLALTIWTQKVAQTGSLQQGDAGFGEALRDIERELASLERRFLDAWAEQADGLIAQDSRVRDMGRMFDRLRAELRARRRV
jgi:hypothetical protein